MGALNIGEGGTENEMEKSPKMCRIGTHGEMMKYIWKPTGNPTGNVYMGIYLYTIYTWVNNRK